MKINQSTMDKIKTPSTVTLPSKMQEVKEIFGQIYRNF